MAEILSVTKHKKGKGLFVCEVGVGAGASVQVVTNAANASVGVKTAFAPVGAVIPAMDTPMGPPPWTPPRTF